MKSVSFIASGRAPLRLAASTVAVLLAWPALAQNPADNTLKEVVVVASRFEEPQLSAPTKIQVITQESIKNSSALSLPDALAMLAGVNVRSNSAGQLGLNATLDLGGFGATATQNTLVLVDGRRLNPIDASDISWAAIPLSAIERIEVASGSAAVQYGAGTSGGVINIITHANPKDATQLDVKAGSFGTALIDFNLNRKIDRDLIRLNASAAHSDGWRENAQAQSQNVSLKAKHDLGSSGYLFAEVQATRQNNGFPGGVLGQVGEGDQRAVKFNNVGSENTANQTGLRLGGFAALSTQTSLDVDLVLGRKSSDFKQPYYNTADSVNTSWGYVTGAGASHLTGEDVSFSPKFRTEYANGVHLVYGYDFSYSHQDGANEFGPIAQQVILDNQGPYGYKDNILSDQQAVHLHNHAVYLLSRIPLAQAWELSLGARRQIQAFDSFDQNKSSGQQNASGSFAANAHELALNYKLSEVSRFYVRTNQSYRFANTDEYWGFDAYGNRVFSGELRPQISKAYEFGYDMKTREQQLSLMLGQSVTHDEIRYNPTLYRNSNLEDDISRTSLSANWTTQVLASAQLSLGARFQRAEYQTGAYSGQTLGLVPKSIYNLGWIQSVNDKNRAGLQIMHVGRQYYDASPDKVAALDQMPAYTTADVFWTRTDGKLVTKLTIKNIAGKSYANYGGYGFVSLPGASGANSYYYFPSDPRSIYLSMNYQF